MGRFTALKPSPATAIALASCALGLVGCLVWSAPASAGVYGGETSQHDPISLTVGKNGHVKSIGLVWSASCQSGSTYAFGDVLMASKTRPALIGPGENALFATLAKGKLKGSSLGADDFGDQGSGAISQKFSGKVKRATATGVWRAHMDVSNPGGTKIDTCDTGTIRWGVTTGPNVYAGSTTQGEPVVIIARKDRSRVDYFGFGWRADCTPPNDFWDVAEEFGNFPLTDSGAFGDTFTTDFPYTDGSGKNSFTYNVHGSLHKKAGSGTLSTHVVESDSAGTATTTCDTNSMKWSVSR